MSLKFEINIFKDLIEKYPTWDELSSYLESEDGGLLKIVDKTDKGFCLIRYEKGISKMELPHSRWFRSVVWNTETNRPVSVAPPKTSSIEFPFKTFKEISNAGIVCQELLDGFMINTFRKSGDSSVYITSRSKLDGTGKFYSEKTFRELFIEAYLNVKEYSSERIIQENFEDFCLPDEKRGETSVFCSYLVQHKDHRIVKPIQNNFVYLIHRGIVFEDGRIEIEDSPTNVKSFPIINSMNLENRPIQSSYAQIVSISRDEGEETEVNKWIKRTLTQNDWQFQGIVFKDRTGNRWRFRSEKYSAVKSLRGNSPISRDRFSQLYTQNLLHKYIEYYPEENMVMTAHLMFMNTIIKILYDNYVDLHITKNKKADEIDKLYLPHLYNIHGIYISQLRPNKQKVNFTEIQLYLHKQPWQRISFLIKKSVEKINNVTS